MCVPMSPTQLTAPDIFGSVRHTAILVCLLLFSGSRLAQQPILRILGVDGDDIADLASAIISFITLDMV